MLAPLLMLALVACATTKTPPHPNNSRFIYDHAPGAIRGKSLGDLVVSVALYGVGDWASPINPSLAAGSPFGRREDPISGKASMHRGQDIGCKIGEPIRAVASGVVNISRLSSSAGKYVEITHKSRRHEVKTRYLHLSLRLVRKGRKVRKGQIIGRCGNTGYSTSPHLHFSVVVDGESVPPLVIARSR